jgi:integrase/recombinase XerD
MQKPTITVFLYRNQPKRDGLCSLAIRITHQRERRFYPTGISMIPADFDAVMNAKRRSDKQKEIYNRIDAFKRRATDVADKLAVFTFTQFEDMYLSNREAVDSINYGFDRYTDQLKKQGRISTASTFQSAKISLEKFRTGIRFADITKDFLEDYERWMERQGNSKTTVGFYLRSLRAVMNRAKIDPALYPFGIESDQYTIPAGRNIKKALRLDEISKLFHHPTKPGSMEDLAKDIWFFMYVCNGMNLKDVCMLKWKNKHGDEIRFKRAKTVNTKREQKDVVVHLKPMAKDIITKWGQPSIDPDGFIFPFLNRNSTPEDVRKTVQELTQKINKRLKRFSAELGIDTPVTTYVARHSFATVLKRSGASIEMISELLGHSDTKTTDSYLAGFEAEHIHKATDATVNFLKVHGHSV